MEKIKTKSELKDYGIPVNDGSKEFKDLLRDRIAESYDEKNWISAEEAHKSFKKQLEKSKHKYVQKV